MCQALFRVLRIKEHTRKTNLSAHGMYSLLEGDLCIYVLSRISGDETYYKKNKLLSEGRVVEGWAEWCSGVEGTGFQL